MSDLRTLFRTRFSRKIGLAELLDPVAISVYLRRATGQKFLVDPQA